MGGTCIRYRGREAFFFIRKPQKKIHVWSPSRGIVLRRKHVKLETAFNCLRIGSHLKRPHGRESVGSTKARDDMTSSVTTNI
jgi:hypothetical protein